MKNDKKDTKKVSKEDQVRANNAIDIEPKLNEELDEIESLAEQLAQFETLSEAPLTFAQRRQRALIMRKFKTKIAAAKKRMAKKLPSSDQLMHRARKAAIKAIRKKVAGKKGVEYDTLSASEKMMIDKRVEQRKSAIAKIAQRLIPQIRKAAVAKLSASNQSPEQKNESFSAFIEETENALKDKSNAIMAEPTKDLSQELPVHRKKRYHMMLTKEGKIKTDLRFRAFRHLKGLKENVGTDEELIELIDSLSEEVYASMNLAEDKNVSSLKSKSIEYRVPYETIKEVYDRGYATWTGESNHTAEQLGFARVNSFLAGGKTFFKEDADLAEDMGSTKHHLGIGSSFKHMQKHAVTHIDKDMDSDVDDLEDMGSDEITGAEKKDFTKIMMKKYELEKKHTKKGDAFESVDFDGDMLAEAALDALRWATKAHAGQERKSGGPYINHPKEVARFVKQFKSSHNLDALISAAYLHDTIEDTDTTYKDLVKQFGGLIADMVKELTSDKEAIDALGKGEYIAQKMAKMSSWALVIKLADRLANVQDIDTRPPEFQKRYANETKLALERLKSDRQLTKSHGDLINAIEKKIKEYVTEEVSLDESFDLYMEATSQEKMVDAALAALGRRIKTKGDKEDIGSSAFEIANSFNLGMTGRQLAALYKERNNIKEEDDPCWDGYKKVKGKKDYEEDSCVKESGAGEWGTDKLAKKYKKDTPNQDVNEAFEMMLEDAQCALISQKDIKELEKFADTLLKDFGLDVEFTRHFGDRMSDDRNNPCITIGELKNFFRKVYANKGTKIKGNAGIEAVIKDVQTKLNMPVVIDRVGGGEVEVRFKTIMRKQNFSTPNRTIQY